VYENLTYEVLLARMIARLDTSLDTSEGSLIYNALAPEAWELAQAYITIDETYDNTFASSAPREYLVLRAAERGIAPDEATYAIWKGEFDIDISANDRFSLDTLTYIATEQISTGAWKLKCETAGTEGNKKSGSLTALQYIDGLTRAELTELLIPGTDEEATETFRARYFSSFQSLAFGGNRADYIEKIESISGVGGVKIYRISGQTYNVLACIINSEFAAPSTELILGVQEAIDPTQDGDGAGMAPIGHIVSIQGVQAVAINISTTITLDTGYAWADVSEAVNTAVDNYFLSLSKEWAATESIIIRISQLEAKILDVVGILDIIGTQLNGAASNITLANNQIPVRGTINAST
jgi:Uncharacterized homolog of phage Mu protein gp47